MFLLLPYIFHVETEFEMSVYFSALFLRLRFAIFLRPPSSERDSNAECLIRRVYVHRQVLERIHVELGRNGMTFFRLQLNRTDLYQRQFDLSSGFWDKKIFFLVFLCIQSFSFLVSLFLAGYFRKKLGVLFVNWEQKFTLKITIRLQICWKNWRQNKKYKSYGIDNNKYFSKFIALSVYFSKSYIDKMRCKQHICKRNIVRVQNIFIFISLVNVVTF